MVAIWKQIYVLLCVFSINFFPLNIFFSLRSVSAPINGRTFVDSPRIRAQIKKTPWKRTQLIPVCLRRFFFLSVATESSFQRNSTLVKHFGIFRSSSSSSSFEIFGQFENQIMTVHQKIGPINCFEKRIRKQNKIKNIEQINRMNERTLHRRGNEKIMLS